MARKPVARKVQNVDRPKREVTKKKDKVVSDKKKKIVEKKKIPESKKPKKLPAVKRQIRHPPYASMIKKVLKANDGHVTSLHRIAIFIKENYKVPPESYRRSLRQALKKMEQQKTIIKVRASYKLSAKGRGSSRSKSPARKKKEGEKSPAKKSGDKKKEDEQQKKKKKRTKSPAKNKEEEKKLPKKRTTEKKEPKKRPETKKKEASPKKRAKKTKEGTSKTSDPKVVSVAESKFDHFWQYEDNGWKNYDVAASDTVEEVYQNYLSNRGDNDVRAVHSGSWEYQVDFMALKQTNIQHPNHKTRNIRRVPNANKS